MEIRGRITEVEFKPRDYFKCRGMVNSSFNESRMWGEATDDGFTIGWFWYDSMPPAILEAFTNIIQVIDTELQFKGIMPKKWPGALDDTRNDTDIFQFEIKKYHIMNPAWISAKEKDHIISVTASSKWFTDDKVLEKDIRIELKEDDLSALFTVLENNL
jgi:hypothetical protein